MESTYHKLVNCISPNCVVVELDCGHVETPHLSKHIGEDSLLPVFLICIWHLWGAQTTLAE